MHYQGSAVAGAAMAAPNFRPEMKNLTCQKTANREKKKKRKKIQEKEEKTKKKKHENDDTDNYCKSR